MVSRIFGWITAFLLVSVFAIATFLPDMMRGYVDASVARANVSSGQRVYETYCAGCHGQRGDGNGPAAAQLLVKPRNFVNGDYKFLHFGESGPLPSDASLALTIRDGLQGSSMPAFPLLPEQELSDVRAYVKQLRSGGWTSSAPPQAGGTLPPVRGSTAQELYLAAGCNACHKMDSLGALGGVGPALDKIGAQRTPEQLRESIVSPNAVIATECPAGPCPANVMPQNLGQRLTTEQIKTLVDFLASQK
jgi:mono/diheme cytochrome c family protein